jgi:hypothetical protein
MELEEVVLEEQMVLYHQMLGNLMVVIMEVAAAAPLVYFLVMAEMAVVALLELFGELEEHFLQH